MTKHQSVLDINTRIELNRRALSEQLSGPQTIKRLNSLNWLRHEISYTEPRMLFRMPGRSQQPWLDFTSMTNLGAAYDYIVSHPTQHLDANAVRDIHTILCNGTHIPGGLLRSSPVKLDMTVNGAKFHAPDPYEIEYLLNDKMYNLTHSKKSVLSRAFDIHYELITLQPFDDFNKRTARIIMNWFLIQNGYRPIIFNKPADKKEYIAAIAQRAIGDHSAQKAYTKYMKERMLRSQEEILKQLKKSQIR